MLNPVEIIADTSAFVLGACVGSFLNVCIYRWPIGLKVNEPARSFCPGCRKPIPIWQNIPLLSWLLLRGRCAGCGTRIAFRYFAVELLTALVFLGLWLIFPAPQALAFAALAVACIVTVFVDFEHYIIPHQVTWGFLPVGLAASALVPSLHLQEKWWTGLLAGLGGAASGFALLWLVVELGKKLFGRKRQRFPNPVDWELRDGTNAPECVIDGEVIPWEDLFSRRSDRLLIGATGLTIDGKPADADQVVVAHDHITLRREGADEVKIELADVGRIAGQTIEVVVPREAMGMGDVYFLCMAGAFTGWQGVLFTVFAASVFGTIFGVAGKLAGRGDWAGRIPFGPWLVAGLWTWILGGPAILAWYFNLLGIKENQLF